ncbi:MAG: hypothetical protein ACM3O5_10420 [Betaproteobacteria bacterium]
MPLRPGMTPEKLSHRSGDNLPGWFSMKVVEVAEGLVAMERAIRPQFLAPNGFLLALFRCTQMILWPRHR